MAKVKILWFGQEPVVKTYRLVPGLYLVRSMGERVSFKVLKGHRAEDLAKGLTGSISESGRTYVIAVSDDIETHLETNEAFPGRDLVTINRLRHVSSGRHPSIKDAKLVIVSEEDVSQQRRALRSKQPTSRQLPV